MEETIIHIGWAKTASTTLHGSLFENHSQLHNIGLPGDERLEFVEELVKLSQRDSSRYDDSLLKSMVSEMKEQSSGRKLVLGHDFFSYHNATDKRIIAERLRSVFGPSKVVATIRNQYDIIKSYYNGLGRGEFTLLFPNGDFSFDDWMAFSMQKKRQDTYFLSCLHYAETLKVYADVFGRDSIKILQFENMVDDLPSYSNELAEFIGIDLQETFSLMSGEHRNKSHTEASFYAQKKIGAFFDNVPMLKSLLTKLDFLQGRGLVTGLVGKFNLAPQQDYAKWNGVIEDMYSAGNQELIHFFKLDLHSKYPILAR
ncbi:MAG: hypothetical protein JEY79_07320 [Pseudodesulfovibrio sp.]|nr:hypothetical protein [Pseudodesulfovibrio sp.]